MVNDEPTPRQFAWYLLASFLLSLASVLTDLSELLTKAARSCLRRSEAKP